jgi:O-antigen/teichoic acid export membrane protein
MVNAPSQKSSQATWLSDGAILTIASFVAAISNYFFQAWMRRQLSWAEFGYMNAMLSLLLFASIPLTAASQTMTHHLAQVGPEGREEKVAQLQAASLKLLRYLTWIVFGLCVLLLPPLTAYLHFPRMSLAWAGLLWVPINLWSTLGGSWCMGLSHFRLYALLLIAAAFLRCAAGAVAVSFYPWAEAGIAASIVSGVVLASIAVFSPHHATTTSLRQIIFQRHWILYGIAAFAVAFGMLAFFQGDQIIAQSHFSGDQLGRYSGAGLLGRTIVWASAPILTIYFTRRSGHQSGQHALTPLIEIYLGMLVAGAIGILFLRDWLLQIFLGVHDVTLSTMTAQFAITMIPIGILQALGCHFLATRRFIECLAFGVCAIIYLVMLALYGDAPDAMLSVMTESAGACLIVLGTFSMIPARRGRAPLIP